MKTLKSQKKQAVSVSMPRILPAPIIDIGNIRYDGESVTKNFGFKRYAKRAINEGTCDFPKYSNRSYQARLRGVGHLMQAKEFIALSDMSQ